MSSDVETQMPEGALGQGTDEHEQPVDEQLEADKKLATEMAKAVEQALERIAPLLRLITEEVDKANKTDPDELDEEALVNKLRPVVEEASGILNETLGKIKGMDPEGKIANNAQRKYDDHNATSEEQRLAKALATLTGDVTTTVQNAKEKIKNMPHAGPQLGAMLGLLQDPLFQILSAVGLLLNGVLTLVGNLLNVLGLGGVVRGLLSALGLDKVLRSLGFGKLFPGLGKSQEKK
ncbi:hypothetical protein L211DRAFT_839188 [Terfezia boudieri ATCC MYA-4762]|uniref:DUF6987 domain-containing protein n=1 Tax=Terfezia boudieri ATCC MYA-4762 TaxID=1051890 RepID=A0A3N4LJ64_9PEZI|nr:hypothetical protein L211DRAFT_839188 [Terfezia boudieri ATCC MYA-4762]